MSQIMQTLRKLAFQWRDDRSGSGPQMADRDRAQCPAGQPVEAPDELENATHGTYTVLYVQEVVTLQKKY